MGGQARYRRSEEVAFRQIGDECLLVPVRTSPEQRMSVFTLNEVGAFLWTVLEGPQTLAELAAKVVDDFEVGEEQARKDVEEFIGLLVGRGLIERVEG